MGRLVASIIAIAGVSLISTLVFAEALPPMKVSTSKKVLLISDIDDTIKVSHVLSTAGKTSRAADITTPFRGMAPLYQWIYNMNPGSTKIVYLSNAPKEIAGIPAIEFSHANFLKNNNFPTGELTLRADIMNPNHKLTEIRRLLDNEMPDVVVMVGDNGERDAEIYHQIYEEYNNIGMQIVPFIHQLYATKPAFYIPDALAEVGSSIYNEQFGYVTPIEIAIELNQQGLLNQEALNWMISKVAPPIVDEGLLKWDGLKPLTFPFFSNCSDFKWRWNETKELKPLIKKLKDKCN